MTDEFTQEIAEKIAELLRFAQSAEAIVSVMAQNQATAEALKRIVERDPDLLPEMRAASDHLVDASAALVRGFEFASARMAVKVGTEYGDESPTE